VSDLTITLTSEERQYLRLLINRDKRMLQKKRLRIRPGEGDAERMLGESDRKITYTERMLARLTAPEDQP
jgi:hypothetical protein